MRLIDADALKNEFIKEFYTAIGQGKDSFDVIGTMAKVIDNAPKVSDRYNEGYAQGYEKGYNQAKVNVARGIKKQCSKHNILIPEWLEI